MTTYVLCTNVSLFLFVFFYFLFADLKDCGYLKEEVPNDRSSYREAIRHFQTTNVFLASDIIMLIPIAGLTLLVFGTYNTF